MKVFSGKEVCKVLNKFGFTLMLSQNKELNEMWFIKARNSA